MSLIGWYLISVDQSSGSSQGVNRASSCFPEPSQFSNPSPCHLQTRNITPFGQSPPRHIIDLSLTHRHTALFFRSWGRYVYTWRMVATLKMTMIQNQFLFVYLYLFVCFCNCYLNLGNIWSEYRNYALDIRQRNNTATLFLDLPRADIVARTSFRIPKYLCI